MCDTAAEVIDLSQIDYRTINGGKTGPVTGEIQKMFPDLMRGKGAKYGPWCEYEPVN